VTTGAYAGRAARGPDLRWQALERQSPSLNLHKIWSDCENGHVKEAFAAIASLKTLCQRMRCASQRVPLVQCQGMYLLVRRAGGNGL
jgi:hypothetical protein